MVIVPGGDAKDDPPVTVVPIDLPLTIHMFLLDEYLGMSNGGIQRGTEGPDPPPLKNHKNIGFLSNTGPEPLKITQLPSQI